MKNISIAIWSILFLTFQCFHAEARQLNLEEALAKANQSQPAKARKLTSENLKLAYTSSVGTTNCFYVVNRGDKQGFMILGADDCAPAILGYVDNGDFDPSKMPANMAYFLERYTQQIVSATRMNRKMAKANSAGKAYIPTIVKARWNQGEPYNRLCTDYEVLKEPTVTGCVATAISQIMRHYEWPVRGKGSYSYTTSCEIDGVKYTINPSADFDVEYQWDKMLYDYNNGYTDEEGDAVALLMRHVGVACNMGYSPEGSGAGTDNPIYALKTHFGYDLNMRTYHLGDYTDEDFATLLYEELSTGRPIYAAGNGHAFICDGYDGEGYFHWNWGWGGSMDGYFMLTGNDAVGGFRDGLCAIVGIQPDQGSEAPTVMGLADYKLSVDTITDYSQPILFDGFMVNRSKRKVWVMYAFKFENEEASYIVPGRCAELDHYYGLTAFEFRCQTVPNGTYKVYPIYRDMENGKWYYPSTNPAEGTPTVTVDVPVSHIYSAQDLVAYREQVEKGINGCAIIMNDLDLSEVCGQAVGSWTPIGSQNAPFKGRVIGNGHTISNLYIRNTKSFQGLFGAVGDGAYITGITLDNTCHIKGGSYVGGIAGGSSVGGFVTITNCGNEGVISASQMNGAGIIGCCYGQAATFFIQNCYNSGSVSGGRENGAITGWAGNHATIENCYNIARVSGNDGTNSFARYGSKLRLENCYQRNTVTPRQKNVTAVKLTVINSGELTYLLNENGTADNWFQNLDTTQVVDEHPVLRKGHPWVYANTDSTYSNIPNDLRIISDGEEYLQENDIYCSQVKYNRTFSQTDAWEPLFVPFPSVVGEWGEVRHIAKIRSIHHYDDNADGIMDRLELDAVTMNQTDSVIPNTPYLVRSEKAEDMGMTLHRSRLMSSIDPAPTWCANTQVKFNLQGVYAPYSTLSTDYVWDSNVLTSNSSQTLQPQRWYMYTEQHDAGTNRIKQISLTIDGRTATGISLVKVNAANQKTYYNLMGRPVNQPRKGIIIEQGRKVLY